MTQNDLIDAVMIIQLHRNEDVSFEEDVYLALAIDGSFKVIADGIDVDEVKAKIGAEVKVSEDYAQFEAFGEALHSVPLGKASHLVREVVAYFGASGISVVRISMVRLGEVGAQTIAFDVELMGGKLIATTTYELEAFGSAGVEGPVQVDGGGASLKADDNQAIAEVERRPLRPWQKL